MLWLMSPGVRLNKALFCEPGLQRDQWVVVDWWLVAVGSGWRLAVGRRWRFGGGWWLVGVGGLVAVGGWWELAVGGWWSLGAVLNKKGPGSLRSALHEPVCLALWPLTPGIAPPPLKGPNKMQPDTQHDTLQHRKHTTQPPATQQHTHGAYMTQDVPVIFDNI